MRPVMRNSLFSYDDICLRPKYSELPSRSQADTSIKFLGQKYRLPVVPANMQDVISWQLVGYLEKNDYFYIMHRFGDANKNIPAPEDPLDIRTPNISIGVNDDSKREIEWLYDNDILPFHITIDVAHGHHKKVREMVEWVREGKKHRGPKGPAIIAGNVATADGYKFLCDLGVDAVKVGIGGGSICSTRYKTGFHIPTAYSVWECAKIGLNIPIIADGGAKHFGDIAKALVLGADMVMSGRWFAECLDSPARIEHGKKIYRGSTSYEAKGNNKHIEGHTLEITEGCTYADRLEEIQQALQSSISYAGGKDLSAFNSVEWHLL